MQVCQCVKGELVGMDSMQIYKGMDIGTAKPSKEDRNEVPHHLIDFLNPGDMFSVADYVEQAQKVISDCLSRGVLPVFCGGTGQYASAISQGIRFSPVDVSPKVIEQVVEEEKTGGILRLYEELKRIDPIQAAQIHPNNKRRVLRALAIYRETGKTMSALNEESKRDGPRYPFQVFAIDRPREELYARIDDRVDEMMAQGLEEEVRQLLALGVPRDANAFQAIGYKEIIDWLDGKMTYSDAVSLIKQRTRNYAKRQMTWYRHMPGVNWIKATECSEILKKIEGII